jgi:outer membrane protein OmpA-like peptidoglycan-associated protein
MQMINVSFANNFIFSIKLFIKCIPYSLINYIFFVLFTVCNCCKAATLLPMEKSEVIVDPLQDNPLEHLPQPPVLSSTETNVQIKVLQRPKSHGVSTPSFNLKIQNSIPNKYKKNMYIQDLPSSIHIVLSDAPVSLFKPGKVEFSADFLKILRKIHPFITSSLAIHVHSDASGSSPTHNKQLSQKRAQWIATQFKKMGLPLKKISIIKGHGSQFLKDKKHPLSLKNRRVFLKILK